MKKWLFALLTVLVFAVPFGMTASAQSAVPNPIIITEETINDSFRVTNPARRRVENVVIDLQPGQSVISATITLRAPRGTDTTVLDAVGVYTPYIENGRVYWTLASATVDGVPATSDQISIINAALGASYRNYLRTSIRPGRVTEIVITDTDIQYFYE